MFSDLHGLFGIELTSDTGYLLTKNFEDGIVGNQNARVLKDNDGNIVLASVFIDNTSVVIAKSPEAVQEVISRLTANKIKQ